MNPFLLAHGDVPFQPPKRAYARLEHCEPADLADADEAVLAFSAVSADWFDEQDDPRFDLTLGEDIRGFWDNYWGNLLKTGGDGDSTDSGPDAFEEMPILRYEVTIRRGDQKAFAKYRRIVDDYPAHNWWLLDEGSPDGIEADVYGNSFGLSQPARVSAFVVEKETGKALDAIFDMDTWPDADISDLTNVLSRNAIGASAFAALDIGQGSATALLDDRHVPFLYHDLGAGIFRNAKTTPPSLRFCWTARPIIILSHWDQDHWAGALKDNRALSHTWIVPRQPLKASHTAFANSILRAGGIIHVWPGSSLQISVSLSSTQMLTIAQCTGRPMNGNCLALRIDNKINGNTLHWLATGDSGYDELPFSLSGNIAAMTVPHHGAKMKVNKNVPSPAAGYARLLYSFGHGNVHGRTGVQHPTVQSVAEHRSQGWGLGAWRGASKPGSTIAGAQVLATAQHPSTHLYGAIAGWDSKPSPKPRPCKKRECNTEVRQS